MEACSVSVAVVHIVFILKKKEAFELQKENDVITQPL